MTLAAWSPAERDAGAALDLFSSEPLPNRRPLRVLDLFAGTGSSTQAFEDRGHVVRRVELDASHEGTHLIADVRELRAADVLQLFDGERPDFIWASPPCQVFSVLRIGTYWKNGGRWPQPRITQTLEGVRTVAAALALIRELNPRFWLAENPRAMLRKIELMRGIPRRTVTYCQYGDTRQKPTDLFGPMPGHWTPRAMCRPSAPCHEAAPRGNQRAGGTCGLKDAKERSRVPYALGLEICRALEGIGI